MAMVSQEYDPRKTWANNEPKGMAAYALKLLADGSIPKVRDAPPFFYFGGSRRADNLSICSSLLADIIALKSDWAFFAAKNLAKRAQAARYAHAAFLRNCVVPNRFCTSLRTFHPCKSLNMFCPCATDKRRLRLFKLTDSD